MIARGIHKDLQFLELSPSFCSFYSEEGQAIGIQFLSDSQQNLMKLLSEEDKESWFNLCISEGDK